MMARLNKMIGRQSNINPLFTSSISYLQDEAAREVKEMKKKAAEEEGKEFVDEEEEKEKEEVKEEEEKDVSQQLQEVREKVAV